MHPSNQHTVLLLALALGLALGASSAAGQSLLPTQGEILAATSGPVPGLPGVFFHAQSTFDSPLLDATGNILFRGRLTGTGVTTTNDRAYFYGRTAADLAILLRSGDAAPGLPGVTLNTASGPGINGSPRLSPNGLLFFGGSLSGTLVTTATDTALFGGPASGVSLLVREGDAAPGTVGAALGAAFSGVSHQSTGVIDSLRVLFQSSTVGGDTTTANNAGWFTGVPGNLELLQRKGDVVLGGAVISALGYVSQMNPSGQVLHDETFSTTTGTATVSNNVALFVYTPGAGNALVVREGDPAPGTVGATFNVASNSWSIGTGSNTFNRLGQTVINVDLLNGDVVSGVNDRGLYLASPGSLSLLVRRSDAAPGTGANFGVANNSSLCLNGNGAVAFQSTLTGGSVTTADDSSIWIVSGPTKTLVAREGSVAPGTNGALYGEVMGLANMWLNDRGQLTFMAGLTGPGVTGGVDDQGFFAYDPQVGVMLLLRKGDTFEVQPGVFKTVGTWGGIQFNNGDGAALTFNHNGDLVIRVTTADPVSSPPSFILRGHVGSLVAKPRSISVATGGVQTLYLNAGLARAGQFYIVAGSASGTVPGIPLGAFTVPLNSDPYFLYTLQYPNLPPLGNTLGALGSQGEAVATLTVPGGIPGLAGVDLYHAYATVDPLGTVTLVSEPARLALVP